MFPQKLYLSPGNKSYRSDRPNNLKSEGPGIGCIYIYKVSTVGGCGLILEIQVGFEAKTKYFQIEEQKIWKIKHRKGIWQVFQTWMSETWINTQQVSRDPITEPENANGTNFTFLRRLLYTPIIRWQGDWFPMELKVLWRFAPTLPIHKSGWV